VEAVATSEKIKSCSGMRKRKCRKSSFSMKRKRRARNYIGAGIKIVEGIDK
jgi:hypothetical protein